MPIAPRPIRDTSRSPSLTCFILFLPFVGRVLTAADVLPSDSTRWRTNTGCLSGPTESPRLLDRAVQGRRHSSAIERQVRGVAAVRSSREKTSWSEGRFGQMDRSRVWTPELDPA